MNVLMATLDSWQNIFTTNEIVFVIRQYYMMLHLDNVNVKEHTRVHASLSITREGGASLFIKRD